MNRLVGEHRHLPANPVRVVEGGQTLPDAFVDMGVVELVDPVIGEKILQSVFQKLLVLRVARASITSTGAPSPT